MSTITLSKNASRLQRLVAQIKKRDLTSKTEKEKIEVWERAVKLYRTKSSIEPDLMHITTDPEFLLQVAYYELLWRQLGIAPSTADRHYETLRAAAAWDYIEMRYSLAV